MATEANEHRCEAGRTVRFRTRMQRRLRAGLSSAVHRHFNSVAVDRLAVVGSRKRGATASVMPIEGVHPTGCGKPAADSRQALTMRMRSHSACMSIGPSLFTNMSANCATVSISPSFGCNSADSISARVAPSLAIKRSIRMSTPACTNIVTTGRSAPLVRRASMAPGWRIPSTTKTSTFGSTVAITITTKGSQPASIRASPSSCSVARSSRVPVGELPSGLHRRSSVVRRRVRLLGRMRLRTSHFRFRRPLQ